MVSIFKTQCCFSLLVSSEEKRGKKKERVREREKRGKREQWMQHMISTWGCRNSEFISMTHWRNQTGEREGGRAEGARKERGRKKRRKRNRGREGGRERERGERKGSPKKDRERGRERERERERERVESKSRLHVAVEGVIWLWRGTNSQVRQSVSPDELLNGEQNCSLRFLQSAFSLWSSVYSVRACLYFPPSMVFSTLSFCPVCWLHVFFGVLELELGALQGLCSSFSRPVLVYVPLSVPVPVGVLQALPVSCLPPPAPISHCFQWNVFAFAGCRLSHHLIPCLCLRLSLRMLNFSEMAQKQRYFLRHFSIPFFSHSICILPFFFGVKTGKSSVWTVLLLSLVALIPLRPSVSPSFS